MARKSVQKGRLKGVEIYIVTTRNTKRMFVCDTIIY